MKIPRPPRKIIPTFSDSQIRQLLGVIDIRTAEGYRDYIIILTLLDTGIRVSEALALTVEDIDFTQGTVRIEHLKSRTRLVCTGCSARLGKSHVFCPKCGRQVDKTQVEERSRRRMRTLPIDGETLNLLREHVSRGGAISRGGKRLIFGINRHRAWQIVKQCAGRALPNLTPFYAHWGR